jgi:hypothetical protein
LGSSPLLRVELGSKSKKSYLAIHSVLIRYWFDIFCEWFSNLLTLATDLQYQDLNNKQGE